MFLQATFFIIVLLEFPVGIKYFYLLRIGPKEPDYNCLYLKLFTMRSIKKIILSDATVIGAVGRSNL